MTTKAKARNAGRRQPKQSKMFGLRLTKELYARLHETRRLVVARSGGVNVSLNNVAMQALTKGFDVLKGGK